MPTLSPKSSDNEESVAIQAPAAKLDKKPFYEGAERGHMRDLILQLIEDSEEALLLTGQSGIGKTALLQQIPRGAKKSWHLCQINATASLDVPALFHEIIAQLALVPPPNKQLNIPLIAELLLQVRSSGVLPVMVVDDIQLLNDEVLDSLLTLSQKSKTNALCPLKLLMSGSLAKDGQAAKHAKRLEALGDLRIFVLMPLRREQTKAFVEQCCLPSGAILSQALTDVVYERSDGVPAAIIAANFDASSSKKKTTKIEFSRKKVITWAAAGSLIVFLAVLYQLISPSSEMPAEEPSLAPAEQVVETTKPITKPDLTELTVDAEQEPIPSKLPVETEVEPSIVITPSKTLSAEQISESDAETSTAEAVAKEVETEESKPVEPEEPESTVEAEDLGEKLVIADKPEVIPEVIPEIIKAQPIVETIDEEIQSADDGEPGTQLALDKQAVIEKTDTEKTETQELVAKAEESAEKGVISDKVVISEKLGITKEKSAEEKPVIETAEAKSELADDDYLGSQWILEQDVKSFTLQIASMRNEALLRQYVADNRMIEKAAYYKAYRDSGIWYVLVYGSFNSKQAAKQESTLLTKRLRMRKAPLVRPIYKVQQDVRNTLSKAR